MAASGSNRSFPLKINPPATIAPTVPPFVASEFDHVPENVIAHIGRQARLGDDIDLNPKTRLQLIGQRDQVKKAATVCHIDKKVEIAGTALLATSGRAEHAQIPRPMRSGDAADVLSDVRNGDRAGGFSRSGLR